MNNALPSTSGDDRKRVLTLLVLVFGLGMVLNLAFGREPTEFEQYAVELINRARANPTAEVVRLSIDIWGNVPSSPATPDLNEGLPAGHLVTGARQPLAINTTVTSVSSTYTSTLIASNELDHFVAGSSVSGRLLDGGYALNPTPAGAAETIGAQVSSGSISIDQSVVDQQHRDWFINNNVAFRVDRLTLLDGNYREVGAAFEESDNYTHFGSSTPNGVISVVNYTYREDDPFITGVAFEDVDGDEFYTPGVGEALGGISIDVYDSETKELVTSAKTFASGGYSIQLPDGMYDLVFRDPVVGDVIFNGIEITGQNVKVDYVAVPEPGALALIFGACGWCVLRRSRRC